MTSVAAVPSPAASTPLAFATPYAQVVGTAVAATQCLREVLDAHNATTPWWRQQVQLVDEPAVRKVAEPPVACLQAAPRTLYVCTSSPSEPP